MAKILSRNYVQYLIKNNTIILLRMDEDTLQTNLNTLKEMVFDEQKLVTYVSLSKDLCIHVNESKQLLDNFIANIRKNSSDLDLNVNYIISGLSEGNKARTTVSTEKDLDDVRKSLKIVFFEHIYSVSKGLPTVDSVALLAVSRFEDLGLCSGLIKSSTCKKRSVDEIGNLKSNSQVSIQTEQKPVNPLVKKNKEEHASKKNENNETVAKVQESKSEPSIKTEPISPKKNAFSPKKADNKKNGVKTQKGIAGFFGKANSAPSKVISKKIEENKQEVGIKKEKDSLKESHEFKSEKMDVDEEVIEIKREVKEKDSKSEVKKEQVNGKSKSTANQKLNQIKKNAKVDKKRKRVLHVSDSESDDEKDPFVDDSEQTEQNGMSDDEIPPTPTVNTVKITSGIVNPKKRRKIVDKTYTDEDGYILTKKEEVYESCSDHEEEVSAKENILALPVNQVKQETSPKDKKNGPKNTKKKISPPQKGKQATMMNFFKKI